MAPRNQRPLTFRPVGVSDSIDGTNAFPGSMGSLANMVHAPGNSSIFVPRPASVSLFEAGPGQVISAQLVVGSRVYGMRASLLFPGYDEPFCYDLLGGGFVAIGGAFAGNLPITQSTYGDWTPPVMWPVTATRIIVCHPGFVGGVGPYFGWVDLSGFSVNTLKGNTILGSAVISSINDGGASVPIVDGVQPGQMLTNAAALGFPAGTVVVAAANGVFDLPTTGNTHGTVTLDGLGSIAGVEVGMAVSGPQFAAGTVVAGLPGGSAVTLSTAALGSASATAVVFSGGGSITVSNPATVTAAGVTLNLSGGTKMAPLWGAGNTNTNPLVAVPRSVCGYNGRAYFAVLNTAVFSDEQNPTQRTYADQALILGSDTPVTALYPLGLSSPITGGIVQALVAFKGAEPLWQITGDPGTDNLALNNTAGSVGTLAPNTLANIPEGLAYIAPDGLRILSLAGTVTEPIGAYGTGVSVPFINAPYPSRMCMAYGQNSLRVSVQNILLAGQPWQEYVLNLQQKSWSGPHSFASTLIDPYIQGNQVGFIGVPIADPDDCWFSSLVPTPSSTFVENGGQLYWTYQTTLLPDNEQLAMNRLGACAVAILLPPGASVTVAAYDESGALLDSVVIATSGGGGVVWGGFTWGQASWGGLAGYLKQRRLAWHAPIVFKQMTVTITGQAIAGIAVGNLYLGYQILGYLLQDYVAAPGPPDVYLLDALSLPLLDAGNNNLLGS